MKLNILLNTEPSEMSAEKFFKLVSDIADMCKYNIVKLSEGDTKTENNIDIFDFMRKVVGMAINLTVKPEENEEDYNPNEKRDLEYIGLKTEQAVEKFVKDIIDKFRERERLEKEQEAKMNKAKQ